MRSFLAIELPAEARQAVATFAASLGLDGVRWVVAENIHLTLRFLGEIAGPDRQRLVEVLAPKLIDLTPFEMVLEGFGVFPTRGRPRVLWVGAGRGNGALAQMASHVDRGLEEWGLAAENRPFSPHVTIGRARDRAGLRGQLDSENIHFAGPTVSVRAMTLFESRLPDGKSARRSPQYVVLERISLERTDLDASR